MDKKPQYWLVFDWKDGYDRQASMQGLTIFALQHSYELAKMLGKKGGRRMADNSRQDEESCPPTFL